MVGRSLKSRIEALEAQRVDRFKVWHRLLIEPGETEEDVRATYEAKHGPIGEDGCIIWRVVECAA